MRPSTGEIAGVDDLHRIVACPGANNLAAFVDPVRPIQ